MTPIPYGITIKNVITDIERYVKDNPSLPFSYYSGYEIINYKTSPEIDGGYLLLAFNGVKWILRIRDNGWPLWTLIELFKEFNQNQNVNTQVKERNHS